MDSHLPRNMLAVKARDGLGGRQAFLISRVVAGAEHELTARGRVIADAPAAGLMAVVLLDQLVNAGGNRADDGELGKVGSEAGPEPVVRAGLVDCPGVNSQPVIDDVRID